MPSPRLPSRSSSPLRGAAFTLFELLVVVTIITLASVLIVPAVKTMSASANYTQAVNTVTAALGNARARAIRTGRATAVAFLFDTTANDGAGQYTLQVLEVLGQGGAGYLTDRTGFQNDGTYAQAFRPAVGEANIPLPAGMGVYGLSYALEPSGSKIDSETFGWYAGEVLPVSGTQPKTYPWIFPRNDARMFLTPDPSGNNDVFPTTATAMTAPQRKAARSANSFMVEFDASGAVVAASNEGGRSLVNAYIEFPGEPYNLDLNVPTPVELDNPANFDPEHAWQSPVRAAPNPEVILRAAYSLAVVDLNKLAKTTRIEKPWMVRSSLGGTVNAPMRTDFTPSIYANDETVRTISSWIDVNAEVITFNRFSGTISRRPPL